jgi:hypothetical protein
MNEGRKTRMKDGGKRESKPVEEKSQIDSIILYIFSGIPELGQLATPQRKTIVKERLGVIPTTGRLNDWRRSFRSRTYYSRNV